MDWERDSNLDLTSTGSPSKNISSSIRAAESGNARVENAFAALILIGFGDVKQLRPANDILRIPFQCQIWREFCLIIVTNRFKTILEKVFTKH